MTAPDLIVPLRHPVYRRLFTAQVIALIGTGLATVALSLLAFDLAGDNAGTVIGVALALKMVAYVTVSPLVTAWSRGFSRKRLLICLDLTRALVIGSVAFVTEIWQVYVLIFFLNACSAGFTPTFQAVIPDVLEDEDIYTEALSLSRLAYELEGLASPAIAAALLGLVSYSGLFVSNTVAFLVSASLVASTMIPQPRTAPKLEQALRKVSLGIRLYLSIPRLRGLFALNLAAAAASAMVIVNTVIYVKGDFGLGDAEVAWGLGAAGAGSMIVAIILPQILRRASDRSLMLGGGTTLAVGLVGAGLIGSLAALVICWFFLGCGLALVQTPAGRLIQRSADSDERPELFAAQFSLSHLCWLLTYPIAGVLGSALGPASVAIILAILAAWATILAWHLWPPPSSGVDSNQSHA